jgi:hypothetical protein
MRASRRPVGLGLVVAVLLAAPAFGDGEDPKLQARKEAQQKDLEAAVSQYLLTNDPISNAYDRVQQVKKDYDIPIEVGAWHWWHANRHSPHDLHYGLPTLGGTYYWYVHADPTWENPLGEGKMGAHVDFRFRDGDERFRSFFRRHSWLWEAYLWAEVAPDTKLKVGKVWRRFGLDWDDCWYGNVAYFDGWKLDPDWGASLETSFCVPSWPERIPAFLQAFVDEDRVNGSIPGADAESADHSREAQSLVARVVPSWKFTDGSSVAVGVSATLGRIENDDRSDETVAAGAVDVTWTRGPWKLLAELIESSGERNPANYVTGGPSDGSTIWELGASYKWRMLTFRGNVSHGNYDGPGGEQVLYLAGVTVAVTKNVDFYVEYVKWDTKTTHGPRVAFEDGLQFVLNWRF